MIVKNDVCRLPDDQKDELTIWFKTDEEKMSRKTPDKKSKSNRYDRNTNKTHGGGVEGIEKRNLRRL